VVDSGPTLDPYEWRNPRSSYSVPQRRVDRVVDVHDGMLCPSSLDPIGYPNIIIIIIIIIMVKQTISKYCYMGGVCVYLPPSTQP